MTMTIEIKQLILRAVVEERRDRPLAAGDPVSRKPPEPAVDREAVIAECTRQVLRELRRGRGR
jgi:hypothetical protein